MTTFYLPDSMGWGNVALCLSDLMYRCEKPRVHTSLFDVDRGVDFDGFEITSDPNEPKFEATIAINPQYYHMVHSKNLSKIIKPKEELQKLINSFPKEFKYGMHIRRGACSKDSENMGCHGTDENGEIKRAYFANDDALDKFIKIVEETDGVFFLASDSQEIKEIFKERFPDKIVTTDHHIVLTYDCDFLKNHGVSKDARYACYLDWFLLSKCKDLYITAGNMETGTDLSTFGYSAGAYGGSNIHFVFN